MACSEVGEGPCLRLMPQAQDALSPLDRGWSGVRRELRRMFTPKGKSCAAGPLCLIRSLLQK